MNVFSIPAHVVLLMTLVALIDFVVLARLRFGRRVRLYRPEYHRSHDFAVLIPVFGSVSYLKNADVLSRYGSRIFVCTTDRETPEFYRQLHAVAERYGFTVLVSPTSTASVRPNQFSILTLSVLSGRRACNHTVRDEIVRNTAKSIAASTIIFLDGDTVPTDDLQLVTASFELTACDLASVRVVPSRRRTMSERLQGFEYDLAMDVRNIYPWLTSGAAMIARADAIHKIMASHSLFFSGGDIEVGKLAKMHGMRVAHLPYEFRTDVPETLRAWFRQRARGWCIGKFRHSIVNADRPGLAAPFFTFYQTVVIYGLLPFRWYELVYHPHTLVFVWAVYCILLVLFFPRRFHLWTTLFPIYAYAQVMVAVPVGGWHYMRHVFRTRHLGRIRFRPEPLIPQVIDLRDGVLTPTTLVDDIDQTLDLGLTAKLRTTSAYSGQA